MPGAAGNLSAMVPHADAPSTEPRRTASGFGYWVPVLGVLGVSALLVFAALALDLNGRKLSDLHPDSALDRVSTAAEVVAGLLAIVITVVAIVVELAANRYTHRITQLFVREPVHGLVIGFFVATTVVCLWISAAPYADGQSPRAALTVPMLMITTCLVALLPYFAFLFRFLAPHNIIRKIQRTAFASVGVGAGNRDDVVEAIAELEDIVRRARQQRDRRIAMSAIDALAGLIDESMRVRDQLPADWFDITGELARDPDFVALSRKSLRLAEQQRLWVENKVLRQYASLLEESLGPDRDLGNLIAIHTRRLADRYGPVAPGFRDLSARAFNTYLRFAIRGGDQRLAYYVLHQYRELAESELRRGEAQHAVETAQYLRSYGHFAFETGQEFLLEVVAMDLSGLVECAVDHAPTEVDRLLEVFLEVDRESRSDEQEIRLRGVRRAQVQLAVFFLERGDEDRARRIFADMREETTERLRAVREELEAEQPEHYWELTDRGINFAYLSPERRAHLVTFFSWFDDEGRVAVGAHRGRDRAAKELPG